ncbi:MAG TPA: penicillin-binding transpeptidase domain-containing protein [Solirubrobacteraceae bacterium]|nr:penicillin-binding transpeptidase domain-containing protein [Solirubrobacteraceae bacterium]
MNAQITKLFAVVVVLFAVLAYFTSRWTVFSATALNNNALNARPAIEQLRIKRGSILAADGKVLAKSVKAGHGTWGRTYPQGGLFSQVVGYSEGGGNAAGLEVSMAKYLNGTPSSISSLFGTASTSTQVGDDVHTTLDPAAQQTARSGLNGQAGSVVALDPRSGAVLAMYSNPTYDDNKPNAKCADACLVNRAVSSYYPPGSTFKIVTATAAINSGKYTPDSVVNGNSPVTVSGVPLSNDGNQSFGSISLTQALTYSVNTVWAPVAENVGIKTMTEYMKRFGFYSKPPLDYPAGEMTASAVQSPGGQLYPPGSPNEDIGRIGIGQGGLVVTPLQMAMVASAVANRGKLMVPHLVSQVTNPDGRTVKTVKPKLYHQVMTAKTAQEVNLMMRTVVDEGTGTPAQLGGGVQFAGKTGTASVGPAGLGETQPWFIGFAPADDPKVAVAVELERSTSGQSGGAVAAPIARDVVQTLLSEGK